MENGAWTVFVNNLIVENLPVILSERCYVVDFIFISHISRLLLTTGERILSTLPHRMHVLQDFMKTYPDA